MSEDEPDSEIIHLIRRSKNANPLLRAEAAGDPQLPQEFLFKLKYDPEENVREAAKKAIESRKAASREKVG